ncbi:MAG: hypothetical protein ACYS4W_12190 [Planctomycetota bacterium]|jgi:hypothetical protein
MMKERVFSLVVAIVLGMLTAAISGCATNRIDLVDEGLVTVETVPSKGVRILWADVYQDGEDMVVCGVVQRRSDTSYPIRAHVDITVLSPEGTVLQETRTCNIYVARRLAGKGMNWTCFRARLPGTPAEGSRVHMAVHSSEHNGKT